VFQPDLHISAGFKQTFLTVNLTVKIVTHRQNGILPSLLDHSRSE